MMLQDWITANRDFVRIENGKCVPRIIYADWGGHITYGAEYLPLPHGLTQAGRPLFSLAEVADIIGIDAIRLNETLIKIGPRFRYRENGQRDS